jgi:hypothetical protein
MASRTQSELSLAVLGLLAWAAAALFAVVPLLNTVEVEAPDPVGRKVKIQAANPAAVGASCGFAIGGGLCFLGVALAAGRDRRGPGA